ncbi:Site-specific DNA-methyltransferase (Adenine-specific) [Moritella viscosa]|uniref:restriction endonuclease subunit S n=1 Tax=Moritella viscosa TaxID=80854 RepID=UPI00091C5F8A|nr:restriction endonuclease subunit S [Moritella viscosa]SGZ08076.1 Site-specific DNA-methyltransferase (Adenine-specific) [Moritella viscosa]
MKNEQLSKDWEIVTFGDIAKQISKRVEPAKTDLNIYVGLEHLDADSLKITRHGVPDDVKGQKLFVRKGQIIFGKRRAYQRKIAVADWDCICSAHAMVLEANPEQVIPDFLSFFMQSNLFMNRAVKISEGSLSPTIKWKVLASQKFKIPSVEQQKRFVNTLKTVNKIKEHTQLSLIESDKLKQSLLANLLLKGVKSSTYVDSNFGSIPSHWDLVTVDGLTIEHKQGFYTTDKYTTDGCYFIRISDLANPRVIFDDMPKVSIDFKTIEQFRVLKGDFLFARSGSIGRYGIYDSDIEAVFASYIIRFRFDESKILTKYFGFFYESILCARQLKGIAQQGSNVNINAENIKKLKVPLPPIEEQLEIIEAINKIDDVISELKSKKQNIKNLFDSICCEMLEV